MLWAWASPSEGRDFQASQDCSPTPGMLQHHGRQSAISSAWDNGSLFTSFRPMLRSPSPWRGPLTHPYLKLSTPHCDPSFPAPSPATFYPLYVLFRWLPLLECEGQDGRDPSVLRARSHTSLCKCLTHSRDLTQYVWNVCIRHSKSCNSWAHSNPPLHHMESMGTEQPDAETWLSSDCESSPSPHQVAKWCQCLLLYSRLASFPSHPTQEAPILYSSCL